MKNIPLTQGYLAIVDDSDYDRIVKHRWACRVVKGYKLRYAMRTQWVGKKSTYVAMHRVILSAPKGVHVDHKNGNGLDNRRSNLRFCTPSQNQANSHKHRHGKSSMYKGVLHVGDRWRAKIRCKGHWIHLGYFDYEWEAAKAYNEAAGHMFGEFAVLNERPKE